MFYVTLCVCGPSWLVKSLPCFSLIWTVSHFWNYCRRKTKWRFTRCCWGYLASKSFQVLLPPASLPGINTISRGYSCDSNLSVRRCMWVDVCLYETSEHVWLLLSRLLTSCREWQLPVQEGRGGLWDKGQGSHWLYTEGMCVCVLSIVLRWVTMSVQAPLGTNPLSSSLCL